MKLKNLLFVAATLLVSIISFSQVKVESKKDDLLFLLRQEEHIVQALKTADHLRAQPGTALNAGRIVIIVCGEAVTLLTTEKAQRWVEENPAVSIMACGLSLDKFGKTRKDLVKGVEYTENGFIKAFELQKLGFLSVEL